MGKKKCDANNVADRFGSDGLRDRLDRLTEDATAVPPPEPAAFPDAYQPFPVDELPEPVRSFVAAGAKAIGCDASFVALPLLCALASAIGNTRRILLKPGWCEPAVLWGATVGDSGTLKSPAFDLALGFLRRRQDAAMKAHEEAAAAHDAAMLRYEANLNEWKHYGHQRGEEPPQRPKEPVPDRFLCSDITVEAIAIRLKHAPRGLLLARDELAGWVDGFDAYRSGRGGDAAHWLEMHRADPLCSDRKTGEFRNLYVPRAAVSVAGSIQPGTLRRVLGRKHFENGLAARLLLAMPPRVPRRWTEDTVPPDIEAAVSKAFDGLLALHFAQDADDEQAPVDLLLSSSAKPIWVSFYDEHADQQTGLADADLVAAWSELEGYAARLALAVHMVRAVASGADPAEIDETSIIAGIRLARWFAQEARRVYAAVHESQEDSERRRLVEFIRAKGGQVSARDLMRGGLCIPTADAARAVLDGLAQDGVGDWGSTETTGKGGRPTDVFVLRNGSDSDTTPSARPP